jgi:DNA-binding response OmpR family regulator
MSASPSLPSVLLLEPQFVLRRTIVTVARELALVGFVGMVLDLGDGPEAVTLLEELRKGAFASAARIPVIVMTSEPEKADQAALQALGPVDVLRKPFKIGALLESVRTMAKHESARA